MVMDLVMAMEDPASVGYTFRTEGWQLAYQNRWVHSFNGFVGAEALNLQFITKYNNLPFNKGKNPADMRKVFMGEYGDPHKAKEPAKLEADLTEALALVRDKTNAFIGFNFFQFQVAYWKSCSASETVKWDKWEAAAFDNPTAAAEPDFCHERLFGTFAIGDVPVSKTGGINYDSKNVYTINCNKPIFRGKPSAVANAYGGTAPDTSTCEKGWQEGTHQYCVSARTAQSIVRTGLGLACEQLGALGHDCAAGLPSACGTTAPPTEGTPATELYSKADWAFSMLFELNKHKMAEGAEASELCNFGGAGVVTAFVQNPQCTLSSYSAFPLAPPAPAPGPNPSPGPGPGPAPSAEGAGGGGSMPIILGVIAFLIVLGIGGFVVMNKGKGGSDARRGGVEMNRR